MDDPGAILSRPPCPCGIPRRRVLQGAAGVALAVVTPALAAGQDPRSSPPMPGDLLVRVGDGPPRPLTAADVSADASPTSAWPMTADESVVRSGSRYNRVVLVRVDPAALSESTRAHSVDGIVAYSAVCTHMGCEVTAFLVGEQLLECDCHRSKFDALDGGMVLDGPALRPLPALPLALAGGRLVVAASFTARPGFGRHHEPQGE